MIFSREAILNILDTIEPHSKATEQVVKILEMINTLPAANGDSEVQRQVSDVFYNKDTNLDDVGDHAFAVAAMRSVCAVKKCRLSPVEIGAPWYEFTDKFQSLVLNA